jgi:hypothetical protein
MQLRERRAVLGDELRLLERELASWLGLAPSHSLRHLARLAFFRSRYRRVARNQDKVGFRLADALSLVSANRAHCELAEIRPHTH